MPWFENFDYENPKISPILKDVLNDFNTQMMERFYAMYSNNFGHPAYYVVDQLLPLGIGSFSGSQGIQNLMKYHSRAVWELIKNPPRRWLKRNIVVGPDDYAKLKVLGGDLCYSADQLAQKGGFTDADDMRYYWDDYFTGAAKLTDVNEVIGEFISSSYKVLKAMNKLAFYQRRTSWSSHQLGDFFKWKRKYKSASAINANETTAINNAIAAWNAGSWTESADWFPDTLSFPLSWEQYSNVEGSYTANFFNQTRKMQFFTNGKGYSYKAVFKAFIYVKSQGGTYSFDSPDGLNENELNEIADSGIDPVASYDMPDYVCMESISSTPSKTAWKDCGLYDYVIEYDYSGEDGFNRTQ